MLDYANPRPNRLRAANELQANIRHNRVFAGDALKADLEQLARHRITIDISSDDHYGLPGARHLQIDKSRHALLHEDLGKLGGWHGQMASFFATGGNGYRSEPFAPQLSYVSPGHRISIFRFEFCSHEFNF